MPLPRKLAWTLLSWGRWNGTVFPAWLRRLWTRDELVAQREQTYVQAALIAWIHIGLGAYDAAFDWLERALEEHSALLISLPSFGFWDPIRSDERFTQLLDEMGLAAKALLPARELLLPKSEFRAEKR